VAEARLALVGDGPDRDTLRARRVEGVSFAGQVADVREWYAAADVVVQPSRWEGMSLAVLEALATGRSVVATKVAGMEEILDVDALVPTDDVSALVAAITARLRSPELARTEGREGRRRVETHHDIREHMRRVLDLEADLATRTTG
jgi:glycosyltransferase involved in cell wall biosynthesis